MFYKIKIKGNIMTLKIVHITKVINKAKVLDDISMELKSGMIVGLKGENGSGKTMLLRMIAGLIFATDGQVIVNEQVLGKDIEFPPSVGVLIENPAFLDNYTGYQNLKILADIEGGINREQIEKTIERVGLKSNEKKKYKKYSLGMKQRLGIAGAIINKPDLLLLDEPTNALDDSGVKLLEKIIAEEKNRGALVIIASHDEKVLEKMADIIYVVQNGKVKMEKDE